MQELWIQYWHRDNPRPCKELRDAVEIVNLALLEEIPEGHTLEEDFLKEHQSDPFELLQFMLDCLRDKEGDVKKPEADSQEEEDKPWKNIRSLPQSSST